MANKIPKNNQNIKYDWTLLQRHGFNVNNVVHDTMIKAGILYPELPKALDFLTSLYTPIAYYKDEGKEFDPKIHDKERLLIYCGKDSLAAHLVNKKQEEELKENGQYELYHKEVAPLILIYKDIDEARILVDDEQKQKLHFKYESALERQTVLLRKITGNEKFNPRSWQQVGRLLYEELKFPKRQKTNEYGVKTWKTDKETLDDLLINHPEENRMGVVGHKIITYITICKKLGKALELIDTPLHPDGSLGGNSNLAGTETGRTSFSKTIDEVLTSEEEIAQGSKRVKRLGRSLQTITKHGFSIDDEVFDDTEAKEIAADLRSMFVPPKGYVFVEGDGSQAEARVVAVLAEDWELLESFDHKPKIHAKTAALIFNIPVESIRKDENGNWVPSIPKVGITYYDLGKKIRHAGNYRLKAFRLSQMTHISIGECGRMLGVFHQNNPKIQSVFHTEIDKIVTAHRILETPFHRRRQFFDRFTEHMYKEATAQIPQSTVSDQTKFTMPRIRENLAGYGILYRFLTEQHDGILTLVRDYYVNDFSATFKKYYERPINFRSESPYALSRDCDLVIPCDLSKSATNWLEMKEFSL
jgi:DNA polymerase I-like protein with 3'-5' exonuclease and polymerase domains